MSFNLRNLDGSGYEIADTLPRITRKEQCDPLPNNGLKYLPGPDGSWAIDLDALVNAKKGEFTSECNKVLGAVTDHYPTGEQLTWTSQEEEAVAFLADPTAPTPNLSAIATARGVTVADMANRVATKASSYRDLANANIGKRQGLEDQIDAILASADTVTTKARNILALSW